MRWPLIVAGLLIGVVALLALIGMLMPRGHVASRTVRFKAGPEQVWGLISDFAGAARWRSDIERVERLPDQNGHAVWLEVNRRGWRLPLELIESTPPSRQVTRIADPHMPFGGTWTWEVVAAAGGGSSITITERGEIGNPFFRVMSVMSDKRATMDRYLTDLGKQVGEEARLE
jgi:uncharacterized protein YndB with AHSA1/START domain